jgi:hypothetical protein
MLAMPIQCFRIDLDVDLDLSEGDPDDHLCALADLVWESGLGDQGDTMVGACDGVVSLDFHREAPTLLAALSLALEQLKAIGLGIRGVRAPYGDWDL